MPETNIENPSAKTADEEFKGLTSTEYNELYYVEHQKAGLDYLVHGYWQKSYTEMVSDATLQKNYKDPFVIDAGCACGSILAGFRGTGLYQKVLGMDLAAHMINLGRKQFGFSDEELQAGSIANLPIPRGSATLVHSVQVLEHVPDSIADDVLAEFARVLCKGGRAFLCLDAIRDGENKEMYMGDPTHLNVQPVAYWTERLQKHGLLFDVEAYNRFVRSSCGPTEGDPRSFFAHYPYWSVWTLIKL